MNKTLCNSVSQTLKNLTKTILKILQVIISYIAVHIKSFDDLSDFKDDGNDFITFIRHIDSSNKGCLGFNLFSLVFIFIYPKKEES